MLKVVRLIAWLGDSKKKLKEFPQKVRYDMGTASFAVLKIRYEEALEDARHER